MARLGERLRQRREEVGLTIEDLSRATKFRPEIIKQFEEGRTRIFHAEAYLRAFVRAYAREVGLDEEEVIRLLEQEKARTPIVKKDLEGKRKGLRSSLTFAILVGVVVALGFGISLMRSSSRKAEPKPLERPQESYPRRVVGSVRIAETDTLQRGETRLSEQGMIGDGILGSTGKSSDSTKIKKRSCLEIVAFDSVYLIVGSDGDTLLSGRLDPGDSKQIFSDRDLVIFYLSNRYALTLKLDGKRLDLPDSLGKRVYDLVIPVDKQSRTH